MAAARQDGSSRRSPGLRSRAVSGCRARWGTGPSSSGDGGEVPANGSRAPAMREYRPTPQLSAAIRRERAGQHRPGWPPARARRRTS